MRPNRTHFVILAVVLVASTLPGCSRAVVEEDTTVAVDRSADARAERHLNVAVACGVAGPYGEIKEMFEEANPGVQLHQEVGNIVTMADRLRDGKSEADLFMTVGSVALDDLHSEGLLKAPPIEFAEDRLVVLVPEGNPAGIESVEDLAGGEARTVAIAAGDSTPGHFAEMALRRAGLWDRLQESLVRAAKPAMLKGFVSEGRADAALVLLTCATKEAKMGDEPAQGVPDTRIALEVPHQYYDRLVCQTGILSTADAPDLARDFAEFLRQEGPQQVFARWDFMPCEVEAKEGAANEA